MLNTDIKNVIEVVGEESQYDEKAKKILGNRYILAHILCRTVDEFKGESPKEVISLIEGEPLVNRVPIEPGMTNSKMDGERIAGLNTEDSEINEGLVRYDILFYVRLRDGLAQIIVNIEAQKDEPIGYMIINRAVFYASRLISSQKDREFVKQNFNGIKQVYSIWICMDVDENCINHIHLTNDSLLGNHNWKGRTDLLNIVLIGLDKEISQSDDEEYSLHRLLGTLFSDELPTEEKINIIESEYDIPMTQDLEEDMDNMCNLSQGIVERTAKKVTEEVTKEVTKEVTREVTKEVTDRINGLNTILINSNRYEDLKRSTEDKDFQNKLLDELVPIADNE
jgi:hypothetical protein